MSAQQKGEVEPGRLVVVGASAGGIEALSVLVGTLPADFPAPIVLAQHLDPRRRSHLEQILQRRSLLPVVLVQDQEPTPLHAGIVYVVPSNHHVSIHGGQVGLEGDHEGRPRPSVDLLLSTAAQSYAENLIAVILTGSGSDGAAGAVDVSNLGGTVIIQNPATALYPSMPQALPPTAVDHVVDLEQIGPLIYDLLTHLPVPAPATQEGEPLQDILAHVGRQANIDFRQYKPTTILRRVERRMAVTHNRSLRDYEQYLGSHPEEVGELVMAFLIKVTGFLRDSEAFEYLRRHVLPTIIERGRANGQVLRFWSAGCATGEEPYSLALLLADILGAELPNWNIRIFATDLDEDAITFARRGLYPANLLDNLPNEYRTRFFEPVDQTYRVSKILRQLVIFGQQDLSRGVPFPRTDLVICRNVLIYFQPELQQSVLDMFGYSLHEVNGYLFLGQAETVRPLRAGFEMTSKKWKIYRCLHRPVPGLLPSGAHTPGLPFAGRRPRAGHLVVEDPARPSTEPGLNGVDPGQLRRLNDWILRSLPTGVAVIDRSYHITVINAAARRILGIHEARGEQDFLHTVRGLPYTQVRNAIDTVFREHGTMTLAEIELSPEAGGDGRSLTLTLVPMPVDLGTPETLILSVVDVTDQMHTRQRLEMVQTDQKQLLDELSQANRRLSDMNKELQDANEELQAANEEMMLTQEELQATNEEFEATNEELQATNEELETNNEELQATNEELETTNEELHARTSELQELMRALASERVRLNEMVELAPFAILILRGPALIVDAVNPGSAPLLEGRDGVGRPFEEVFPTDELGDVVRLAHTAYHQGVVQVTPRLRAPRPAGQNAEDRYLVYTIVPTHDSSGKVDGVVLYAEDVTTQMARAAAERLEQFKLMIENAAQVALGLYDAHNGALVQASERYLDILERVANTSRDQIIGRTWASLPLQPPGEEQALFQAVAESAATRRLPEVRLTLGDGEPPTIWDFSLIPISGRDGDQPARVEFVVVSAIEVTDQARAREELERLDQLKDEFLALASHELRTPLVPLRGYAELIRKVVAQKQAEPGWDPRIGRYVSKFDEQLRYIGRLVDDLFDIGRLQNGKFTLIMEPVDLQQVVAQVVEQCQVLSADHICRVTPTAPDSPLVVLGDEQRLVQVVLNLVENAIKYAPDSKQIDIRLGQADGQALLAVQDHGPGIPAAEIPDLFTRFYQGSQNTRPSRGGLGLGLFIARQLMEQQGGTLTVDSTVGQGSTFTIRLPLAPVPAP